MCCLVLTGTVLKLALKLARENNIELKQDGVDLSSVSSWRGAFVASTTRGVRVLNTIRFRDHSKYNDIEFKEFVFEIEKL